MKQLTMGGQAVRITDNGKPLWVIHPDGPVAEDDPRRRERSEGEFEVMLGERKPVRDRIREGKQIGRAAAVVY